MGRPSTLNPNKKYNMLTPIQRVDTEENIYHCYWSFKCDCGNIKNIRANSVVRNVVTSCGCTLKARKSGKDHKKFGGYEGISGTYWANIRCRARSKNREFTVSIQEAWEIFDKQKGRCCLSGRPIKLAKTRKDYATASIDRIDSKLGYVSGNIQWVHVIVNWMKSNMDQDDFIFWCKDVWENSGEKKL